MPLLTNNASLRSYGWPWTPSPGGIPQPVTDIDSIRANLMVLYSTQPGDDKTQLTFGTDLNGFIFETAGDIQNALVQGEVVRATTLWEPRVTIDSVTVDVPDDDTDGVEVDVEVVFVYQGQSNNVTFTRSKAAG